MSAGERSRLFWSDWFTSSSGRALCCCMAGLYKHCGAGACGCPGQRCGVMLLMLPVMTPLLLHCLGLPHTGNPCLIYSPIYPTAQLHPSTPHACMLRAILLLMPPFVLSWSSHRFCLHMCRFMGCYAYILCTQSVLLFYTRWWWCRLVGQDCYSCVMPVCVCKWLQCPSCLELMHWSWNLPQRCLSLCVMFFCDGKNGLLCDLEKSDKNCST